MRIEQEKIQLAPLNLQQVGIAGQIVGSYHKMNFPVVPWLMTALEMMQQNKSIQEIFYHFLSKGSLVSFVTLKELLHFLVNERLLLNPSFINYFQTELPILETAKVKASPKSSTKPPSDQQTIQQLKELPFMRALSAPIQNFLFEDMEILELPPRTQLCQIGETERSLFILIEGEAAVFKRNSTGRVEKAATLNNGSVFGEVGFFLGLPRTAHVVTEKKSRVAKFVGDSDVLDNLIKKDKAQQMQTRLWLIHALLNSTLFKNLADECFDSLIFSGEIKSIPKGRAVITEGERSSNFYVLIQGSLQVSQKGKPIRELNQGDSFGEIALMLSQGVRTATVTAQSEALVLEIDATKFYRLLSENLFMACEFEATSLQKLRDDQKRWA
ncbi:MAG: cyclic nucleotide-binding domain-containing protein [Bdellovibrionota bacterium]